MTLRSVVQSAVISLVAAAFLNAQAPAQTAPAPAASPATPKPKSQKEVEALQKVSAAQQARNPDGIISAVNNVLENFADTEYKPMLLSMAMEASAAKGDTAQTSVFADRVLEVSPNDIPARVTVAESMVQKVRENDLDKEQILKKVDDYANKALDLLKTADTPPAGMPAAQWPDYKKTLTSESYDALGQTAALRKNYPDSIKQYKAALEAQPTNTVAMARLSKVYVDAKQYDDAIATADKVLAVADAPAAVKTFAQQSKDNATKLKSAAPVEAPK